MAIKTNITPDMVTELVQDQIDAANDITGGNATVLSAAIDAIDPVDRASTTMETTVDTTNAKLTIKASNDQGTGYVAGSNQTASKTITLTASGKTVTASDGSKSVSKSVATANRAATTATTTANDTTDVLTITATNAQTTGYVTEDSSKNTATKTVTLGLGAPTIDANGTVTATATATDNSSTPVSVSKSTTLSLGAKDANNLTVSGNKVTAAAGYYPNGATKEVPTVARASTTMTTTADTASAKLTISASNNQGTGYVTADSSKNTATKTVTLTASGKTVTASDGTNSVSKDVATGSVKTPATSITANPSISVGTDGKITASVSATKDVAPSVTTAGYVSSGTAGTITVSGSAESQLAVKSSSDLSKSGATVTAPAGYYPAAASATISNVSGSIGGTAAAGAATAAITNVNSMNTISDLTNKTAGTDYFTVKATATGTAGGYTPKYTVNSAGYIGSTVTGSKQTVSVSSDSTGKSIHIPKATVSVSGSATAGKATAAITNTDSMRTVSSPSGTAGTDYYRVKATATGTAGSYTPSMSVTSAGYLKSNVSGSAASVSVSDDSTGKTINIPKASFTKSGASIKTTSTGGGYIGDNVTVGTVDSGAYSASVSLTSGNGSVSATGTNITLTEAASKPSSGYYVTATGSGSVSGTGTATIGTAGYLATGSKTSGSSSKDSNTATKYYTVATEEKSVTPSTSAQTITPASNKLISKVSVGAIATETKSVTPTKSAQDITPTSGKYLTKVSVAKIPDKYVDTTGATAEDYDIRVGKSAWVNGVEVSGALQEVGPDSLPVIVYPYMNYWGDEYEDDTTRNYLYCSASVLDNINQLEGGDDVYLGEAIVNDTLMLKFPKSQLGTAVSSHVRSGETFSGQDGFCVTGTMPDGSATMPASITGVNPVLLDTYESGKGYKMAVNQTVSATPTVGYGYIESGTRSNTTITGSAYVPQSTIGNATNSTTATAARTIGYNQQAIISAGYYPSDRIIRTDVPSAGDIDENLTTDRTSISFDDYKVHGDTRVGVSFTTGSATPETEAKTYTDSNKKFYSSFTVNAIPSNYKDTSSGDAAAGEILEGKKAWVDGVEITGTMANKGQKKLFLGRADDQNNWISQWTIDKGYHDGTGYAYIVTQDKTVDPTTSAQTIHPDAGKVLKTVTVNAIPSSYKDTTISSNGATATQILSGKKAYVNGSLITGSIGTYSGTTTITPTKAAQQFETAAKYVTGKLTVNAIPDEYIKTTISTDPATSTTILSGKKAYVDGLLITGTMTNNGAVAPGALGAGGSYTIPAGYHNGSGKVTAASLAGQTSGTAAAGHILKGKTAWVNGSQITGTVVERGDANLSHMASSGTITITASPGMYTGGASYSFTDNNLKASNIKSGTTIFGVEGSYTGPSLASLTSDATAAAGHILSGKTAYVNGSKITGSIPTYIGDDGYLPLNYAGTANGYALFDYQFAKPTYIGDDGFIYLSKALSDFGNATAAQVLKDKTFTSSAGVAVKGTMETKNLSNITSSGLTVTVPKGYYAQSYTKTCSDTNLKAENIKAGVTIFGVTGTYGSASAGTVTIEYGAGMGSNYGAYESEGSNSVWDSTFTINPNSTIQIEPKVDGLIIISYMNVGMANYWTEGNIELDWDDDGAQELWFRYGGGNATIHIYSAS